MTARACRRTVSKSGAISAVRSARLSPAASCPEPAAYSDPRCRGRSEAGTRAPPGRPEDAVALIRKAVAVKPGYATSTASTFWLTSRGTRRARDWKSALSGRRPFRPPTSALPAAKASASVQFSS